MLIQKLVRHDSIIASQRLVAEFCNTIPLETDMTGSPRDVAEVPRAEVAAPSIHPRRPLYAAVITCRRSFTRAGVQWEELMNRRTTSLLAGVVIAASPVLAADVTPERLINADREPQNWLMNHRTYDGQRFSPLSLINRDNVKNLKLAF